MVEKVKDPVCGMEVEISSGFMVKHMGKTYYFCSEDCKRKFEESPHKYVHGH